MLTVFFKVESLTYDISYFVWSQELLSRARVCLI